MFGFIKAGIPEQNFDVPRIHFSRLRASLHRALKAGEISGAGSRISHTRHCPTDAG
jgi:hypothetical protein